MKKLIAIFLAMVLMLCAVGCQSPINSESDTNSEGITNSEDTSNSESNMNFEIDENLESDIIKAYIAYLGPAWDLSEDELSIDSYGTYSDCTVGYINGPFVYLAVISAEKVGPYIFRYSDSQKMLAYKDGQIKSMKEAYALGWLDDEAVKQILEKHKQAYPVLYG